MLGGRMNLMSALFKIKKLLTNHDKNVWNRKHIKSVDVNNFRNDNVFVWQTRLYEEYNYFISYIYAKNIDKIQVLAKSQEDGSYGVETFEFDKKLVSRDLLDSTIEINFLSVKLGLEKITNLKILDIGAGYGRFAKRMTDSLPNSFVYCIDAIDVSRQVSKRYLSDSIAKGRVEVLSMESIAGEMPKGVSLAVNIHSFSEMSIEWVTFWVKTIFELEIDYVFVVPNGPQLTLNDGTDFSRVFHDHGYTVIAESKKYEFQEFEKFGIYPASYFLLKRLK
jgi:putative sugar O-methyltransferase